MASKSDSKTSLGTTSISESESTGEECLTEVQKKESIHEGECSNPVGEENQGTAGSDQNLRDQRRMTGESQGLSTDDCETKDSTLEQVPINLRLLENQIFSKDDMHLMKQQWKSIVVDEAEFGVYLYQILFKRQPEFEKFFSRYYNPEGVTRHPKFVKHMTRKIVHALHHSLLSLNNKENLIHFLEELGAHHTEWNVTQTDLEKFSDAFMEAWGDKMGFSLSAKSRAMWNRFMIGVVEQMKLGIANGVKVTSKTDDDLSVSS